jgi:hypothetical protein
MRCSGFGARETTLPRGMTAPFTRMVSWRMTREEPTDREREKEGKERRRRK